MTKHVRLERVAMEACQLVVGYVSDKVTKFESFYFPSLLPLSEHKG